MVCVALFSLVSGAVGQTPALLTPGDHEVELHHDGFDRAYLVHVPEGLSGPAPVVFALHGGGGNMDYVVRHDRYRLVAKSDEARFILVVPNGFSRKWAPRVATWNAGRCCAFARDSDADDVGFIRSVVDDLSGRVAIDHSRVFAAGMSNGGMMAFRLACDAADLFRGIMAVAGTDNTRSCAPSRPVALLEIHAVDDDHVQFGGGAGPKAVRASLITHYTSVPETVAKWVAINGADPVARTVLEKDGARCERHDARPGGAPVELCVTESGGHSWPGSIGRRATPSTAIDATDEMWRFFSGL